MKDEGMRLIPPPSFPIPPSTNNRISGAILSRHIRVSALASGSKGNSVYIDGPEGSLLVDAGLSARELMRRLAHIGASPDRVSGILVTHDHSDHLRGVRVLAKRLGLTVYGTAETLKAAELPDSTSIKVVSPGEEFCAAGFTIKPFSLPHDARDPVGFLLAMDGVKIGVATDLGYATALIKRRLAGCDMLVLESNYDESMLMEGPYPWFLKQRIRSRKGHLSNEDSSQILRELLHPDLQHVILAHLSEVNNCPEVALSEATGAVRSCGNGVDLTAAGMAEPTSLFVIEK
jgi:phosphoribosyl 1,2-cyclic phosphodiesterase